MTDKPTPQDFIEAANVLQDVASRDKPKEDVKAALVLIDELDADQDYLFSRASTGDNVKVLAKSVREKLKTIRAALTQLTKPQDNVTCGDIARQAIARAEQKGGV